MQISQQWFIYYRIRADDQALVTDAVRVFQSGLCERWPGLRAQVWRRTDRQNDMLTLMETYEFDSNFALTGGDTESFCALRGDIAQLAWSLSPWLQSARHCEEFSPCV